MDAERPARIEGDPADLDTSGARSETRAGQPGVSLEVADNGVGIPEANRERLFDPHFSTKTSGTGLGLAIVARIVQDMGGTIDVESLTGRGTTFSLWFASGGAEAPSSA